MFFDIEILKQWGVSLETEKSKQNKTFHTLAIKNLYLIIIQELILVFTKAYARQNFTYTYKCHVFNAIKMTRRAHVFSIIYTMKMQGYKMNCAIEQLQ